MADTLAFNSNAFSWASCRLKIRGKSYYGVKSFAFGEQKRNRVKLYGLCTQAPIGVTKGDYEAADGKLEMFVKSYQELMKELSNGSGGGKSYGEEMFDVLVQYRERGSSHSVEARRCWIAGETSSETYGPEASVVEVAIGISGVIRDGRTLFDSTTPNAIR